MSLVLETDDLTLGEEIEIALVPGNGFTRLRVFPGMGGGGGGTVTSVSGSAPIVITGTPSVTPTVTITAATDSAAGSMSAADKTKLDGLSPTPVDTLSVTAPITNTGTAQNPIVGISAATDVAAGSMSAADKTKLDQYGPAPTTIVVQPGGTASGNVFTGFDSTVVARANEIDGPVVVFFDVSKNGGAAIVATAGSYAFTEPSQVTFAGSADPNNADDFCVLQFPAGSSLAGVNVFQNITVVNLGTTALITLASGSAAIRFLTLITSQILVTSTGAFVHNTASTPLQISAFGQSFIGDGVNGPVVSADSGTTVTFNLFDVAQLLSHALGGAGTFAANAFSDAVTIGTTLGATCPITLSPIASQVSYNDSLVAPTLGASTVQAAIDDLKSGSPVLTWSEEAAGAAITVAAQKLPQFFGQDTAATAASGTYSFPAHGTAIDGQEVTITLDGAAVATGVNLAPGTGNVMADPNNAGSYGASGATLTALTPGQVIRRKYKDLGLTGKWRPF